jgi:hypothetical protein
MAHKKAADLSPALMRLGIQRLSKALEDVRRFNPASVNDQRNVPDIPRLSAAVDEALVRTFGADTLDYERYRRASDLAKRMLVGPEMPIADVRREFARVRARSIGLLEQAISGLEAHLADPMAEPATAPAKQPAELLTLKPSFWGMSLDLKEAWRRARRWWRGSSQDPARPFHRLRLQSPRRLGRGCH